MRLLLTIFLLFYYTGSALGQIQRTKTWYFGEGILMHFEKDSLRFEFIDKSKITPMWEGTGIYNSKDGRMVYFRNESVTDSFLNSLKLGNFPSGGSSTASQAVILTSLDDSILHHFGTTSGSRYFLTEIDITKNKYTNNHRTLKTHIGQMQAHVNHQNGLWQWVVCHSATRDTVFSFLITNQGVEPCPVINRAGPVFKDWYPTQGSFKFKEDGSQLYFTTWDFEKIVGCIFNNQLGSIPKSFDFYSRSYYDNISKRYFYTNPYGLEIYDNKLFVSNQGIDMLCQYDLSHFDKDSIKSSEKMIFEDANAHKILGTIQRAMDGNLYVGRWQQFKLGKIYKSGNTYLYDTSSISTYPRKSYDGFPSFNASYFHTPAVDFKYTLDCSKNEFHFTGFDTFRSSEYQWKIKKNTYSGTGKGQSWQYSFPDTGLWSVTFLAKSAAKMDSVTKMIYVESPVKTHFLGSDIIVNPLDSACFGTLLGPENMHCKHWYKIGQDAEHIQPDFTYTDTGSYICRATNRIFCTFYDTIKIKYCDSFAQTARVEKMGDSLFSKEWAHIYQWYRLDTMNYFRSIADANMSLFHAQDSGVYGLKTFNLQGCGDTTFSVVRVLPEDLCDSFAQVAIIEKNKNSIESKNWAFKYQWYTTTDSNALIGLDGENKPVFWPNKLGKYALRTYNVNGCFSTSNWVLFTQKDICHNYSYIDSFNRSGDTLFSMGIGTTYQWYKNDTLLYESAKNWIILNSTGYYSVKVGKNSQCDTLSKKYAVATLKNTAILIQEFKIQPNPNNGSFILSGTKPINSIEIFDNTGKLIVADWQKVNQYTSQIKLNGAPGVYTIKINQHSILRFNVIEN